MSANAEATVTLSLVDRVTGPIKRIGDRLGNLSKRIGFERITNAVGNLGNRIRGLGDGLARTSMRLGSFFTLLGVGGAGVITSAYGLAKSAADVGAEVNDMAVKLGIGVEALQEYRFAAKMSGVEVATFDKGVEKLGLNAVSAAKGNKELGKAFATLGVRVKDSKGKMRGIEDILDDTMARLSEIQDPLKRNALAFKLFGKSGVDLTKIMGDGASGIRALREEARRTGNVFSKDATKAADELGDNVDALTERLAGLKNFVGIQLIPVFNDAVKGLTEWYDANATLIRSGIQDWVKTLGDFIRSLLDPTSEIRTKMREFGESVTSAYEAIKPFVDFIGGPFKTALALITLWALAPAITAITLLAMAFRKLGLAVAGSAVSTIVALSGAVADVAGASLAKSLTAAGSTAGNLYGKAFAVAVRLAILAGIAAVTVELLQKFDPKGNLGGITKPVDDWWRRTTGLPAKDTGVTPGEIVDGIGNLMPSWGSSKPATPTSGAPERLSPVAGELGFNNSAIPAFRSYGGTTDSLPGKTKDDVAANMVTNSNNVSTVTINAPVTINAKTDADPASIGAAVRRELGAVAAKVAASNKSSLSD